MGDLRTNTAGLVERAQGISSAPYRITYPSRAAAQRVRDVLCDVLKALAAAEARNRVLVEALKQVSPEIGKIGAIASLRAKTAKGPIFEDLMAIRERASIAATTLRRASEALSQSQEKEQGASGSDIAAREASRSDGQGKSDGGE